MSRTHLMEGLMNLDLKVLGINPTKGELKMLTDSELAQILTNYDTVKNTTYATQRMFSGLCNC